MKQEELSLQMISFLQMFSKIQKGEVKMKIKSVIVNKEFHRYLIKKGLVKLGVKRFNKYPLSIDDTKYADVWGFEGSDN